MVTEALSQLYRMAQQSPSREICGILTSTLEIIPIINVARNDQHFVMQKSGFFRALNKIKQNGQTVLGIYHSHPNNDATPSVADMEAAKRTGYNYLIVTPSGTYKWVEV